MLSKEIISKNHHLGLLKGIRLFKNYKNSKYINNILSTNKIG
jgi:hypothetical protein